MPRIIGKDGTQAADWGDPRWVRDLRTGQLRDRYEPSPHGGYNFDAPMVGPDAQRQPEEIVSSKRYVQDALGRVTAAPPEEPDTTAEDAARAAEDRGRAARDAAFTGQPLTDEQVLELTDAAGELGQAVTDLAIARWGEDEYVTRRALRDMELAQAADAGSTVDLTADGDPADGGFTAEELLEIERVLDS